MGDKKDDAELYGFSLLLREVAPQIMALGGDFAFLLGAYHQQAGEVLELESTHSRQREKLVCQVVGRSDAHEQDRGNRRGPRHGKA